MSFRHTNRKGFWIGFVDFFTAGIFLLLYMPFGGLQDEIEAVLGHKVMPYWKAYLLGIPTLFLYTLVWMARIAEELKEKAVALGIGDPYTSWRHMFGWNTFGLLLMGPAVATLRFFDTLNRVEAELNRRRDAALGTDPLQQDTAPEYGCRRGGALSHAMNTSFLKLEIFIPESHLGALQKALREVDAGHIGSYDACLSYSRVMGTWRPLPGASPYIGEEGKVSCEPELKVEVTVRAERLDETIRAIKTVHPYEEPVINAIPLWGIGLDKA